MRNALPEPSETENIMQVIEESLDSTQDMFLTFTLFRQFYGLRIQYIAEIISMQKVTFVPDVASAIKGVINFRGQVISIIDLCICFNLKPIEYNDRTCIIILSFNHSEIGLVVERISEVIHVSDFQFQPPISRG